LFGVVVQIRVSCVLLSPIYVCCVRPSRHCSPMPEQHT
jgi:hypothetical protein